MLKIFLCQRPFFQRAANLQKKHFWGETDVRQKDDLEIQFVDWNELFFLFLSVCLTISLSHFLLLYHCLSFSLILSFFIPFSFFQCPLKWSPAVNDSLWLCLDLSTELKLLSSDYSWLKDHVSLSKDFRLIWASTCLRDWDQKTLETLGSFLAFACVYFEARSLRLFLVSFTNMITELGLEGIG